MNCNNNCNNNYNNKGNTENKFMDNLEKKPCNDYNDFCIPYEQGTDFNELARAFVLFQKFCGVMCLEESLVKGTAFEELYMPYTPSKDCKKTKVC